LFSYLEGQDYVNDMVEFIKKDIKEDRALLKVIDPEILTLEEKLKDSKEVIERYKSDYEDTLKKKDAFSELYLSWDELQTVAGKYEAITTRGRKIKLELQDLKYKNFSKTEKLLREYKQIEVLLDQLEQLEEDVSVSECSLSLFSDKSIESIESDLRTLRTLKQLHLRFQEKKLQQEVTECKLNEITEDIANGKSEFEKLILSKNICPYSGFPLSKACKKLILEKI
jgi:chromosome segregation ATPase